MSQIIVIVCIVCLGQMPFAQTGGGLGLDITFGANGVCTIDLKDYDYTANHVCDGDGNIFVFGTSGNYSSGAYDFDAVVLKLNAAGVPDASFGQSGILNFDFPGRTSSNISHGLVHQNHLYLIGSGYDYGVSNSQTVFIAKIDSIGLFDSTFGQNGLLEYNVFGDFDIPGELTIDENEKIVYSLTSLDTNYAHMEIPVMGRLSLNGTTDSTFGQDGRIFWHPLSGLSSLGLSPNRHQDGAYLDKILELDNSYLFSGYYYVGEAYAAFALMVDDTGSAISTFGQSGQWLLNFNPGMNNRIHKVVEVNNALWMLTDIDKHDENKNLDIKVVDKNGVIQSHLSHDSFGNLDEVRDVMLDEHGAVFALGTSIKMSNNSPGYRGDLGLVHSWLPSYADNSAFAQLGTGTCNPDTTEQIDPQSISNHLDDQSYIISVDRIYSGSVNYSDFQILKVLNESFNSSQPSDTEKSPFNIYPNPCNGRVYVSGGAIRQATVRTIEGRVIKVIDHPQKELFLQGLPSGTYVITIESIDGNTHTQKLVLN